MGVSIYWRPWQPASVPLDVGLRSKFVALMQEEFGVYPWTLVGTPETFTRLRRVHTLMDNDEFAAFETLERALRASGTIVVEAVY